MAETDPARPYCDCCGGLVEAPAAEGAPLDAEAGIVCDACVRSRRVLPESAITTADEKQGIASRFRCPHCDRRLKTRAISKRTEVECPRCKGTLVLLPEGGVEPGAPAWSRPPAKEGGGRSGGAAAAAPAPDEGAEDAPGEREDASARADLAPRSAAPWSAPGGDLPSDLAEMLATRAAFDARAASDSSERFAAALARDAAMPRDGRGAWPSADARRPRESRRTSRPAPAPASSDPDAPSDPEAPAGASDSRRSRSPSDSRGSSDRVPLASEGPALVVSSSEWPAAPTFEAHRPLAPDAPGTPEVSAARASPAAAAPSAPPALAAPAARTKSPPRMPAAPRALLAPAAAAPPALADAAPPERAPWGRLALAATLLLLGAGGAWFARSLESVPGPLGALGERIGTGYANLEGRLR
jgi:hypothetical protein